MSEASTWQSDEPDDDRTTQVGDANDDRIAEAGNANDDGTDPDGLGRPAWSVDEMRRRANLVEPWLELVNAPCIRSVVLRELGEGLCEKEGVVIKKSALLAVDDPTNRQEEEAFLRTVEDMIAEAALQETGPSSTHHAAPGDIGRIFCCSGLECNPQLAKEPWDMSPRPPRKIKKPKKKTLASRLLKDIETWVQSTTERMYGDVIGVSEALVMDTQMQYAIANRLGASDSKRRRPKILANKDAFYREDALSAWAKKLEEPAVGWEEQERLDLQQSLYDAACRWKSWDAKAYVGSLQQEQGQSRGQNLRRQEVLRRAQAEATEQAREDLQKLQSYQVSLRPGETYRKVLDTLAVQMKKYEVLVSAESDLSRPKNWTVESGSGSQLQSTRHARGRGRPRGRPSPRPSAGARGIPAAAVCCCCSSHLEVYVCADRLQSAGRGRGRERDILVAQPAAVGCCGHLKVFVLTLRRVNVCLFAQIPDHLVSQLA